MEAQLDMPRSTSYARSTYSMAESSAESSRRAPPPINRLQLAAALLEYDNEQDEEDGYEGRDHRESAMFVQFARSADPSVGGVPTSAAAAFVPPTERRRRDSRYSLAAATGYAGESGACPRVVQPYEDGEPYPGADPEHGAEVVAGMAGVGAPAARMVSTGAKVDIGSWELPSHLLHSSPTKPEMAKNRQRPVQQLDTDTDIEHAEHAEQPPSPTWRPPNVGEIVSPAKLYSRPLSATAALPPLSAVRAHLVSPTHSSTPRAQSIHLDMVPSSDTQQIGWEAEGREEMRLDAEDEATETLSRAERTRRMVEDALAGRGPAQAYRTRPDSRMSSYSIPLNDANPDDRRPRTLSSMTVNPASVPLPISPGPHMRTLSSLSYSSRYEPSAIPLPVSPSSSDRRLRTISGVSFATDLQGTAEEVEVAEGSLEPNPFAIPAPPEGYASRFDPKAQDEQRRKSMSFSDAGAAHPSSLRPAIEHRHTMAIPFPQSGSVPINLARGGLSQARAVSMMDITPADSFAPNIPTIRLPERAFADIPSPDEYAKPLRPSPYGRRAPPDRTSLLRPKTLVMPAPLEGAVPVRPKPKGFVPEGWALGDKPLPKEARTSILVPFPEADDEEGGDLGVIGPGGAGQVDGRRPGKLYGTNLMDQLEMRKAAMKGKQRVFEGDARPAMFSRSSTTQDLARTSFLPSSVTLPILPSVSGGLDAPLPAGEVALGVGNMTRPGRMVKSASVFGVDQIWERDMEKFRLIQAREAQAKEEAEAKEEAREQEREERRKRKEKGKEKMRGKPLDEANVYFAKGESEGAGNAEEQEDQPRTSVDPPRLDFMPLKGPATTMDLLPEVLGVGGERERRPSNARTLQSSGWDSDDDEREQQGTVRRRKGQLGVPASEPAQMDRPDREDSDEEPLSVALTRAHARQGSLGALEGRGPSLGQKHSTAIGLANEEDEDEVPISQLMRARMEELRAGQPSQPAASPEEEEEDDVPLSRLTIRPASSAPTSAPTFSLQTSSWPAEGSLGLLPTTLTPAPVTPAVAGAEDDDDDLPLGQPNGLRAAPAEEDDDDVPLGAPPKSVSPAAATGLDGWQAQHYAAMEYARQAGEAALWQAQVQQQALQAQAQAVAQAEWARQSGYISMGMGMDMGPPSAPWMGRRGSGASYGAIQTTRTGPTSMGGMAGGWPYSGEPGTGTLPTSYPGQGPAGNIDTWRQQVAVPRSRTSSSVGGGAR